MIVPEAVRAKALACGGASRRWLADLGDIVAEVERDWGIAVGATLEGGTSSFVAEVVNSDGTPAVLKLAMPTELDGIEALCNEVSALLLADGRSCVRLINHDLDRGGLLMERLGRQLFELGKPVLEQMQIICSLLSVLWAVPCDGELPTLESKGRWLSEFIASSWEELGQPCPGLVIEAAIGYAERRSAAFDREAGVLVHGDAHAWNTLEDLTAARPGAFKLVDPDGLVAEPEYDLAILMREFTDELLAGDALRLGRERARFLARHTGLDEQKIWEWGYVERVSTGLLCMKVGRFDSGRDFLRIAELWSA